MEEIYWLQRLGALHTFMWTLFGISVAVLIVLMIIWGLMVSETYDDESIERCKMWLKRILKLSMVAIVLALGGIFIPSTNEMYAIYGIGGTIDYLKENETAKQLPDKVINALDKWIDESLKEDKKD